MRAATVSTRASAAMPVDDRRDRRAARIVHHHDLQRLVLHGDQRVQARLEPGELAARRDDDQRRYGAAPAPLRAAGSSPFEPRSSSRASLRQASASGTMPCSDASSANRSASSVTVPPGAAAQSRCSGSSVMTTPRSPAWKRAGGPATAATPRGWR